MTSQQEADLALQAHWQGKRDAMIDPYTTIEVKVEQRLVGLYSAARTLRDFSQQRDARQVLMRPKCLEEIKGVRDALSLILKALHK